MAESCIKVEVCFSVMILSVESESDGIEMASLLFLSEQRKNIKKQRRIFFL